MVQTRFMMQRCVCVCVCVTEVGPASVMVGNLVAGKRMAQASGRDLSQEDNDQVCMHAHVCI